MKVLVWREFNDIAVSIIDRDKILIDDFIHQNFNAAIKYNYYKDDNGYSDPDEIICTLMAHSLIDYEKAGECSGAFFYNVSLSSIKFYKVDKETAALVAPQVDFWYSNTLQYLIENE